MSREIYKRSVAPHNARVAGDAGIPSDNVQAAILLMQDMQPDIDAGRVRLFYSPEITGSKTRAAAPYLFATKGYSANSPQRELGEELITNAADREFTSDTGWWTKQTGWSISGGRANLDGTNPSSFAIFRGGFTQTGSIYLVEYRVVSVNGAVFSGAGNAFGVSRSQPGLYRDLIVAGSTGNIGIYGSAGTIASVDDISVRLLIPADLTQTTANSQPYLDKIAPSEPWGLKNVNGDNRFMSHTAISFAAGDKWTYEMVVDMQGSIDANILSRLTINTINLRSQIRKQGNSWLLINDNDNITSVSANTHRIHGKKTILHFVANGDNTMGIYHNGSSVATVNVNGGTVFNFMAAQISGGGINHHRLIFSDALPASRIATRAALLRSIFPEIPTVKISGLDVAVRALDIVCTPAGTVMSNITENVNVEKALNGDFEVITGWNSHSGAALTRETGTRTGGSGTYCLRTTVTGINAGASRESLVVNRYYRVRGWVRSDGVQIPRVWVGGAGSHHWQGTNSTDWQYFDFHRAANETRIYLTSGNTSSGYLEWDDVSFEEVGWSGLTGLYNGLIAQGQTAAQAQAAVAAWCHHSNNLALGSVYGKIYNGYAKDRLVADLAASNFGYHIATEAEWNIILDAGANSLKARGTAYWNTANGTNLTGLTLLGGGARSFGTGDFVPLKLAAYFWCGDSDRRVLINDDGTSSIANAPSKVSGYYILLIKNQ